MMSQFNCLFTRRREEREAKQRRRQNWLDALCGVSQVFVQLNGIQQNLSLNPFMIFMSSLPFFSSRSSRLCVKKVF
jgi:hypothetical protein